MIEVEIKLQLTKQSAAQIEEKLVQMGFSYEDTIIQEDRYYDNEDSFIRQSGQALRLRSIKNEKRESETVITFKGKKLDQISMTRQELETSVGNPEVLDGILQALLFHVIPPVVRKTRKEFTRKTSNLHLSQGNQKYIETTDKGEIPEVEMHACIDHVDGLGDFLELEIMAEEEKRESALGVIENLLHTLGYRLEDTSTNSYLSMLQGVVD